MSCGIWALMATVWGAGQQIAQSAASDGAPASAAVNEEEVRGPHASLAVRLQVSSSLHLTHMFCALCLVVRATHTATSMDCSRFVILTSKGGLMGLLCMLACTLCMSLFVVGRRTKFCCQECEAVLRLIKDSAA